MPYLIGFVIVILYISIAFWLGIKFDDHLRKSTKFLLKIGKYLVFAYVIAMIIALSYAIGETIKIIFQYAK